MSTKLSSRPERPVGYLPADPWVGQPEEGKAPAIRRQATEIIAAVLSDSTPQQAPARAQLRLCLEAYPGRPEVALAAHLIALREEAAGAETAAQVGAPPTPRQSVRRPILHQRPTERVHYGRPGRRGSSGLAKDGN